MGQAVKGVGGVGGPVPCLSPQPRLPPICKPAAPLEGGGDAWKGTGLVKANEGMQRRPAEEPALGDRTNKRLPLPSSWSSGPLLPFSGVSPPGSFSLPLAFSHSCSFLLVSEGGTLLSGDLPHMGSSGYRSLWRSSPTCIRRVLINTNISFSSRYFATSLGTPLPTSTLLRGCMF